MYDRRTIEDHANRLLSFIRARVGSDTDAENIMQAVFLAFYARWNIQDPIRNALYWLLRTARHKVADWYRERERRPSAGDRFPPAGDSACEDLWRLADAHVRGPDDDMMRTELRQAIAEAIAQLPTDQRDTFIRTELEGLTFRELSERTGVKLNTLLARKRYAVLKLRRSLAEWSTANRGV